MHSVLDYVGASTVALASAFAATNAAKAVSLGTSGGVLAASLLADYRLSVAKVLPIEAHEVLDHLSGIFLASAPFAFGYYKKDRLASIIQIASGAALVLTSLFTDYRAQRGIGMRHDEA